MNSRNITPANGKLGVLTPGMGAVASTFIAGVLCDQHVAASMAPQPHGIMLN